MNLWQSFKLAFKSISMKKTRSFLTMLICLTIGS